MLSIGGEGGADVYTACMECRLVLPVCITGVQMYYQQPPHEPAPVAPSRREKKIIDIIDPRTGVNVIADRHEALPAEWKSLTTEV